MIRVLSILLLLCSVAYAASSNDPDGSTCCGSIVIIGVIVAIVVSNKKKNTAEGVEPDSVQNMPGTSSLQLLIERGARDFGGVSTDCLFVKISGPINLPLNMLTAVFSLSLWDVSRGSEPDKRKPVLCSLPELQLKGSQMFLWTNVQQMTYANSMVNGWIEILFIPLDFITFPAKGNRELYFDLSITPLGQAGNTANRALFSLMYVNKSLGYVDGIQIRIKAEELGLKYAAAVSAIDGEIDSDEKTVIRNWMDTRIDSLPEDMRAETTRSLSRALMIAERLSASIRPEDIELLCDDIVEDYPIGSFPKGELYDIVELCMKVAAADGIASPEELKLVDRIASLLHVDMDRFRKMSEKILPVNIHSKRDVAAILGLKAEWTVKQRKKHLRDQYREWSARVTHSDAKVRDQADEMLRIIAEERAKIDAY